MYNKSLDYQIKKAKFEDISPFYLAKYLASVKKAIKRKKRPDSYQEEYLKLAFGISKKHLLCR